MYWEGRCLSRSLKKNSFDFLLKFLTENMNFNHHLVIWILWPRSKELAKYPKYIHETPAWLAVLYCSYWLSFWIIASVKSCMDCLIIIVSMSFQSEALEGCGFPSKSFSRLNSFVIFTAKSFVIVMFVWNNFSQVHLSHNCMISLWSVKLKPFLGDI